MNQTVRITGIVFCILFALASTFLNNKFKTAIENSIEKNLPDSDIEKQSKKYLLFLIFTVMAVIFFTAMIILIEKKLD
ncbi:MAG: hypothetical protein ACOX1L_09545 [Erysipelotrichaceae bacterium]|jgi:hypothetical protein